jgi:hypothetical protein
MRGLVPVSFPEVLHASLRYSVLSSSGENPARPRAPRAHLQSHREKQISRVFELATSPEGVRTTLNPYVRMP